MVLNSAQQREAAEFQELWMVLWGTKKAHCVRAFSKWQCKIKSDEQNSMYYFFRINLTQCVFVDKFSHSVDLNERRIRAGDGSAEGTITYPIILQKKVYHVAFQLKTNLIFRSLILHIHKKRDKRLCSYKLKHSFELIQLLFSAFIYFYYVKRRFALNVLNLTIWCRWFVEKSVRISTHVGECLINKTLKIKQWQSVNGASCDAIFFYIWKW